MGESGVRLTVGGTEIRANGTMTPCVSLELRGDIATETLATETFARETPETEAVGTVNTSDYLEAAASTTKNDIFASDAMDTSVSAHQCPCGYLHGPDMPESHDISAVGFSSNMMRGPD